jgi:hypothetical protein
MRKTPDHNALTAAGGQAASSRHAVSSSRQLGPGAPLQTQPGEHLVAGAPACGY